jgi:hypothetical protein
MHFDRREAAPLGVAEDSLDRGWDAGGGDGVAELDLTALAIALAKRFAQGFALAGVVEDALREAVDIGGCSRRVPAPSAITCLVPCSRG